MRLTIERVELVPRFMSIAHLKEPAGFSESS